jgi:uncharacterized protein YutE (UPF0331/DUF86 family)
MKKFQKTYDSIQHIHYCAYELDYYKKFIDRYERFIKDENEDYEKFLNNPDSFFELGLKFNFERIHSANLSTEFPNTLRRSAFLSLMSFFENSLNKLCEVYEERLDIKLNFTDMNERGIDRAKLYLEKVIQLDFPNSSDWEKIKKLQEIRNIIVHRYSEISNDDKKILSLKKFPHLKLYPLTSKSIIQLDGLFLENVIDIFKAFYKELLKSVKKRSYVPR